MWQQRTVQRYLDCVFGRYEPYFNLELTKKKKMHILCSYVSYHRCKQRVLRFFYYFYKKRVFNFFYLLNVLLFSSGDICYPTKPAKINQLSSCIKRFLSDGLNMAAIKSYLMKSRSPQTLSCILRK